VYVDDCLIFSKSDAVNNTLMQELSNDFLLQDEGDVNAFLGVQIKKDKLQTEIALSMTESEYIALSTAARELIPLRCILSDIHTHSFINLQNGAPSNTIKSLILPPSKIFEDNNACIVLATTKTHFKPQTKHISLKFHNFHDQVHQGYIEIIKIGTNENMADIFTKPLGRVKFQYLRQLLLGW